MATHVQAPLAAADHTAVVAFCLARSERLAGGASDPDVLLRAAHLARGRIGRVLASAADRQAPTDGPSLEGLRVGMRVADEILKDGAQTIYRLGYWVEEGMLVIDGSSAGSRHTAEAAIAGLAHTAASAAVHAGWSQVAGAPGEAHQAAILAAIAASVPVALILAEGAHNQ